MPTGSSSETRKRRLSSCQRRLSVICRPGATSSSASIGRSERAVCSALSSTMPWLFFVKTRKTPCGVRSAVHASPSSVLTMRKFVSVSVGELNALDGVLLGDLARHEADLAARGQAGDGLVRRVVDDRALHERPAQRGAEDERRAAPRSGRRRAMAAGARRCAGPRASSSCAASGAAGTRRPRAARAATSQTSGDGPEEHRDAVPHRPDEPQHDEHDHDDRDHDRVDPLEAPHRARLYVVARTIGGTTRTRMRAWWTRAVAATTV